jgi:hypothetical protein
MRAGIASAWGQAEPKSFGARRSDLYWRAVVVKSAWNRGGGETVAVTPFEKKEKQRNRDGRKRAPPTRSRFRADRRDCKAIPIHGRSNGWLEAWVFLEYENSSKYTAVYIVRCYVYDVNFDSKERWVCGRDVWDHCDPGSSVPVCC